MCLRNYRILLQFSSVTQLCLTLYDPMDCNMLGFPVHHQLLELAQSHVHWVSDTIQPLHSLSSPSPSFSLSQHQSLFQWVSSSHQVTKYWSFNFSIMLPMNIQDWFPLRLVGSPCNPRDSHESSPTPQFKSISSSVLSFLYGQLWHSYMTTAKNHSFD